MKEIKPRLIFTDRKQRSWAGSAWNIVIILLTFCVGVYVGIKLSDMDLPVGVQKEAHKVQTTVLRGKVAEQRGEEANLIEEEKVSIQQSSSSVAPQSVADTYSQQVGSEGVGEGEVNENGSQEYAKREQELDIDKKEGFTVQIGAFKEIERANRARNELKMKGYEPYILPYVSSLGTNWYLVRIGRFNTREEAREYALSLLRVEGMEVIVERME
ncbi:MAG: SPOR domain-containing protein [Thermodesulfobacteriota bacterium]